MKTASIHLPQSRQRMWNSPEINSTFDIEGIYTGSIFLKSNQTTSVETGKINPSLKFKDYFGGLA